MTSVFTVGVVDGIVVGTPIGAPSWFGFIGSAILVAVLWRTFDSIVPASEVSVSETVIPCGGGDVTLRPSTISSDVDIRGTCPCPFLLPSRGVPWRSNTAFW